LKNTIIGVLSGQGEIPYRR